MNRPLTAAEEAQLRESVRLIEASADDDAGLQWANESMARLLATLDAARAAQEAPAPEGENR